MKNLTVSGNKLFLNGNSESHIDDVLSESRLLSVSLGCEIEVTHNYRKYYIKKNGDVKELSNSMANYIRKVYK